MYLIGFVTIGFLLSFLGFKKLISITYPIIGYAGIVLIIFLIYAYIRDFQKSKKNPKEDSKSWIYWKRNTTTINITAKKMPKK